MEIKEFEVNSIVKTTLVVTAANARETRSKKPYLQLTLSDGQSEIMGNYWDWSGKAIPKINAILDVSAQVTEWQGSKQLNIQSIRNNETKHISEFVPASGFNIREVYKEAIDLVAMIEDQFLASLGLALLEEPTLESLWLQVPGAVSIHHAYVSGTLVHSVSVANIAKNIARAIPYANKDLCIFGGLFHDIGKLYGYQINGLKPEMSEEGCLLEHTFMGAQLIDNFANNANLIDSNAAEMKMMLIKHIILSHHGKREYGAAVTPQLLEAHIVHTADDIDARAEQIRCESAKLENVKYTDKIWALDNKQHITVQYINNLFSK